MKLSLPVIFQVFGTLLAAQAVVSQETMNIAEIAASLPDFSTLVGFVTVENSAIQPILARLTGDVPTSTSTTAFEESSMLLFCLFNC